MTIEELNRAIKSYTIPRVFFFFGEETYLLENKIKSIKDKIVPKDLVSFNFSYLNSDKITPDEIIEAAEIFPQVSDRRLVVVKNSGLFSNLTTGNFKSIKEYILNLPEYVCLIFWEDGDVYKRQLFRTPTCGAAKPTPFAAFKVSVMSSKR